MSVNDTSIDSGNGTNGVSTDTVRKRLHNCIHRCLHHEEDSLISAPTSIGKSYCIATTPWSNYPEITGEKPIVHLHATKASRDEAVEASRDSGLDSFVLRGRTEVCPVTAGEHDGEITAPDGSKPSEWFNRKCDFEGIDFRRAHQRLADNLDDFPCSEGPRCKSISQWAKIMDGDGNLRPYDVIHATHEFARVASLANETNVIIDERPAYFEAVEGSKADHISRSVNSYLEDHGADDKSWIELVKAMMEEDEELLGEYTELFATDPTEDWFWSHGSSHSLTSEIGKAISQAQPVSSSRYCGWAGNIAVLFDSQGNLRGIHNPPDLSDARCVIGLDAHPSEQLWQLSTVDDLTVHQILADEERRRWRQKERHLKVVQVGKSTRQYTCNWRGAARSKAQAIVRELRAQYGDGFRTAISAKSIRDDTVSIMEAAGINDPHVLYYGNLKSRNDFGGEMVGLLVGAIDPGDDYILDRLALRGLNADPKLDDSGKRDYGREFVGEDRQAAAEILAAVREDNIAQAIGRYARRPGTRESQAVVYVWTDAIYDHMVDEQVPGVVSNVTELKEEIAQCLRRHGTMTKTGVAEEVGCSPKHAWDVLEEMNEQGALTISRGTGYNGANEYTATQGSIRPSVDLGF